jgi:hypothetical protein
MKAQGSRFSFSRDYTAAREMIGAATTDANAARDAARQERDRVRRSSEESLRRARTAMEAARAAMRIAPSPRDGRAELERLRRALEYIEKEFPGIETLAKSGDFRAAETKSLDAESRIQEAVSRFFDKMGSGGRSSRSGPRGRRLPPARAGEGPIA